MSIEGGMPRVLIDASKKGNLCAASTQGDKDNGAGRIGMAVGAVGAGAVGLLAMMMM